MAAAYAALVSLMNDLELTQNHPRHSFSFDNKQITSLSQTVGFLIDFMESYDAHGYGCSREVAEALESRIASATHAAHDVIESRVVDQIHSGSTLRGKVRSSFFFDLQKVIDNMDYVRRKAMMQCKEKSGLIAEQLITSSPPLTSRKNERVGFEVVSVRLLGMLAGEPCRQQVIPIVGMGGMGKTTLARHVYEHLLIQDYFDVRFWSTISQEYSSEAILTELLFGERKSNCGTVNELGEQLHKKLWGRRYLIILDDMWSLNAWDEIQMFFPNNSNGSCVIVTTRLEKLATCLSSSPFEMNFLNEDESWELFCGKAFGEESCPLELEEIGKKIVKRCQRLPLSIVVVGGHLRKSSRDIEYWEKVGNLMNPVLSSGEDNQCFNILSLSYQHLPLCLKPCFVYMGIFQEDRLFRVSDLVQLWISEGFVRPKKGLSLEEVAEDYLQDLIDRNLILVYNKKWNGKTEFCAIHDILRELCLKVAKKDNFLCLFDGNTQAVHNERRIAVPMGKHDSGVVAPLLRSLISHGEPLSFEMSFGFRLLRVSSSWREENGYFPVANFQQFNLRYLASVPFIYHHKYEIPYILPWSISHFWNLQTLSITGDYLLIIAPSEIWEMSQLRQLDFRRIYLPDPLFQSSNQQECTILQNLHKLSGVCNFKLSEEVCKRIPNIKELSLSYFPLPSCDWEAISDYCPYNLGRFHRLEILICSSSRGNPKLQSFTFPSSLQELHLTTKSHLGWEDLTVIMKSLPHLGLLDVDTVQGLEWNLDEEEFPSLKILKIYECVDLIYWNANSSHFPALEILQLWYIPGLVEIPFDIGEIPTLQLIKVEACSVSAAVSAMRIVAEQESFGNHDLRVEIDFQKMEEVERCQKMVQEEDIRINNLRLSCHNKKI